MAIELTADEAAAVIPAAARVMRAIATLDRFESDRRVAFDSLQEQVRRLAAESGTGPPPAAERSAAEREAEALQAQHTARQHALRAQLAGLIADAGALVPIPPELDVEAAVIESAPQPREPGDLAPMELPSLLLEIEAWNARVVEGLATELGTGLAAVLALLDGHIEPEARRLQAAAHQVLGRA